MKNIDQYKAHLEPRLVEKQKVKGTWDSPCLSICNYMGENFQCPTCGLLKEEKVEWVRSADADRKKEIWQLCLKRKERSS